MTDEANRTEDEKLVHEFVLENIWIGLEQTRQAISNLDNKANNMIVVSGVLITILGGVLISSIDSLNALFILLILLPLIGCMYYAFETIKLRWQEILDVEKASSYLYYKDYLQALGDMSVSVGQWQKRLKENIIDPKSLKLMLSMGCFKAALILVLLLSLFKIFLLFCY